MNIQLQLLSFHQNDIKTPIMEFKSSKSDTLEIYLL